MKKTRASTVPFTSSCFTSVSFRKETNMKSHQPLVMYLVISFFCAPLANVYCSAQERGRMMVKRSGRIGVLYHPSVGILL